MCVCVCEESVGGHRRVCGAGSVAKYVNHTGNHGVSPLSVYHSINQLFSTVRFSEYVTLFIILYVPICPSKRLSICLSIYLPNFPLFHLGVLRVCSSFEGAKSAIPFPRFLFLSARPHNLIRSKQMRKR